LIWVLLKQFFAFLHFGPYVYRHLWLGPCEEELIDVPDDQKTEEDVPDDQKTQEDFLDD
jgi:hypothetical protein